MKVSIAKNRDFNTIAHLVEEVQNLHAKMYPAIYKPYQPDEMGLAMENLIKDPQVELWVAFFDNKPIGYMLLMIKQVHENAFYFAQQILHIDQLAVLKTNQHLGIGSMLINKAEEIAAAKGISRLELDYLQNNQSAALFFSHKGFSPYRGKLFKQIN